MQGNNKKKICIVASSLGQGGAQKSAALISIMLYDLGYDVHFVSILNVIEYEYRGKLFNLGLLKDKDDSLFSKTSRLLAFKNYLKKEQFDILIDTRARTNSWKHLLISRFVYVKLPIIYMVGSYKTASYFPKSRFFAKYIYSKAHKIVTVSKEIEKNLIKKYNFRNLKTIYNALEPKQGKKELSKFQELAYIMSYGRLDDDVKNFSLLINAYKQSILPKRNIKLLILGSGKDEDLLKDLVKTNGLMGNVIFEPFDSNPLPHVRNAKFVCLTSRYEGFPMVILESLSVGTPVISVNCKSGPKEVIMNEKNGLLVENYNELAFAEAMNRFVLGETLYNDCKANAIGSVEKFSMQQIAKQWKLIIEE